MKNQYLFTSESVSEGHPDKVCDQISDALLDAYIKDNPQSRVAIETLVTTDLVVLSGETSNINISSNEIESIVRNCIKKIGYEQEHFDWKTVEIISKIHSQSADIAQGVNETAYKEEGAGDQGIMFGFACAETDTLMPAPLYYANKILMQIAEARHNGEITELGPDAKSQITLLYENGMPVKVGKILVSSQHKESIDTKQVREIIRPYIERVIPKNWMCSEDDFLVNPTGKFVIGGPHGDTGLTGRKIIVDTYGGAAPHGGGAFSGKDPTKVDRSASYAARYVAKNIVHAGLSKRCLIQISYAIGISKPLSLYVKLGDDAKISEDKLINVINKIIDLSPKGIRNHLQLNKPIYSKTSAYGHFGRTPEEDGSFSWEKTDLIQDILSELT
ncbi:MAG: methionine adenosyltransferase [Alphaproteobacteria bacterium]|jgi:S-adenosylmethionine synthetase|tara:strand:+ start:32631 stop:33794 length:1164 start_codon:yes stop_codon:yes gene_type:complete